MSHLVSITVHLDEALNVEGVEWGAVDGSGCSSLDGESCVGPFDSPSEAFFIIFGHAIAHLPTQQRLI